MSSGQLTNYTTRTMNSIFRKIASKISLVAGNPKTFLFALILILLWALTGPMFNYSDTWQLAVNTTTTIITFLMVFLIQNTQNRDTKAVHLKLDELIKSVHGARDKLIDIEEQEDIEMEKLQDEFQKVREKYQKNHKS